MCSNCVTLSRVNGPGKERIRLVLSFLLFFSLILNTIEGKKRKNQEKEEMNGKKESGRERKGGDGKQEVVLR